MLKVFWNKHFPPGSILPVELKLSQLIRITRAIYKKVFTHRLARNYFLTIHYGKPTKVNNF
ncbi:MAG: hypothetical protein ACTS8X_01885 [Arsenophonus sp. ER-NS5-MAG3]